MEVGRHTYGQNHISQYQWNEGAKIKIGTFCSIAENVKIFYGGDHQTTWASTFPFDTKFNIGPKSTKTNGDVIIGNDVWISHGVTIMSGVTIGDGVIIAANSHVVKNAEPYTMIGGNPAKQIKHIFSPEIIEKLMILKWWEFDDEKIKEMIDALCVPPTVESIQQLIDKYKK